MLVLQPTLLTADETRDPALMLIWAQTFLDEGISQGLILSSRISSHISPLQETS